MNLNLGDFQSIATSITLVNSMMKNVFMYKVFEKTWVKKTHTMSKL
jgi:uncharacterized membrane protein